MRIVLLPLLAGWLWLSALPAAAAPAPNDAFANRILLTGPTASASGSNKVASKEPGEPDHAGNVGGKSLWWTWTAPSDGDLILHTDGSDFDTLLAVYTGSTVGALSPAADNDDHGVLVTSRVRFEVVAGTTYQIAVDGYSDSTTVDSGEVRLTLAFTATPIRPPNDAFATAVTLDGATAEVTGPNLDATREPGEPLHAEEEGDTSVWWTWTAPFSGTVTLTTEGSSFDTLLGVYTGDGVTYLTVVASNDDEDAVNGILTSRLSLAAVAGVTYRIAVDGYDGASGQVRLRLVLEQPQTELRWEAPQLLPDGSFDVVLTGSLGAVIEVEQSEDAVAWTSAVTLTNTTGSVHFTVPAAAPHRLYRAVQR
jgi:hypothetical protein